MDSIRFTDIHCHGLYGIDDGAKNEKETIEMIKLAYEEGIRTIIFTPHFYGGNKEYSTENTKKIFGVIVKRIKEIYPDMNLYLGNEILFSGGILEELKKGNALTLANTKYTLVEFNVFEEYNDIYSGLKSLIEGGYRPIIAHVERYEAISGRTDRIDELIKLGAYIQVNCKSLTGGLFNRKTKWLITLLNDSMIHFIADDSHGIKNREPIMKSVYKKLEKKVDKNLLRKIAVDNIERLMDDDYI